MAGGLGSLLKVQDVHSRSLGVPAASKPECINSSNNHLTYDVFGFWFLCVFCHLICTVCSPSCQKKCFAQTKTSLKKKKKDTDHAEGWEETRMHLLLVSTDFHEFADSTVRSCVTMQILQGKIGYNLPSISFPPNWRISIQQRKKKKLHFHQSWVQFSLVANTLTLRLWIGCGLTLSQWTFDLFLV